MSISQVEGNEEYDDLGPPPPFPPGGSVLRDLGVSTGLDVSNQASIISSSNIGTATQSKDANSDDLKSEFGGMDEGLEMVMNMMLPALHDNTMSRLPSVYITQAPASQDVAGVVNWDCLFTYTVKWGKNQEGQDTVNEYVLLGELGRGSFGRVHLCERRVGPPPWRRFAMKIMSKPRLRRLSEYVNVPGGGMRKVTAEDKMRLEIEIMRYLYHRNVVILFEVLEVVEGLDRKGNLGYVTDPDDEGLVCMIEEYMEGGPTMVYDEVTGAFRRPMAGDSATSANPASCGPRPGLGPGLVYSEDEAKPLFRDLVQGLLYLHDQGIVHRDIKPDNLLVFENGTLRICDFGCARRVRITRRAESRESSASLGADGAEEEEEEGLTNSVGTYTFHSPESLSGDGRPYSGRAADAWAAACTLYCWSFGHLPFHDDALEPLFAKIRNEELQVGQAVSGELASLLRGMFRKDPAKRIRLRDALEHPWMHGVPDPPPPAGFKPPES